jgi:hypothetical protein
MQGATPGVGYQTTFGGPTRREVTLLWNAYKAAQCSIGTVACGPRMAGGVADLGITGLVLQESPVTITEICARANF